MLLLSVSAKLVEPVDEVLPPCLERNAAAGNFAKKIVVRARDHSQDPTKYRLARFNFLGRARLPPSRKSP